MKRLLASLALVAMVLSPSVLPASDWQTPPVKTAAQVIEETKVVRWEGSTDDDMLKAARSVLDEVTAKGSKIKTLKIYLVSPGGPVVTSLEIARLLRRASDRGLIVEIHGEMLVASGGTFVLASGTPGHRFIQKESLFLVHGPQIGSMFGSSCVAYKDAPVSEMDKVGNTLLKTMRNAYVRYTKRSVAEVEKWITCGEESIGDGDLAVSMGIADKVEN